MLSVASILDTLYRWAPRSLGWEKDNIGLLVGALHTEVLRVLVCLDVTEAVVDEAVDLDAQLIVAHHPVIFRPLSTLRTDSPQGRILHKLLRHDIAVIAMHTNADATSGGINTELARLLDVTDIAALEPAMGLLQRLEFRLTAESDIASCVTAVAQQIADVRHHAQKLTDGSILLTFDVLKDRSSTVRRVFTEYCGNRIIAESCVTLDDALPSKGIGIIGTLVQPERTEDFLAKVKDRLGCTRLRTTPFDSEKILSRIAVCGGAGSTYLRAAISAGAQCMVTGDLTHHTFLDYGPELLLVDAGHFETENIFVRLCCDVLLRSAFQDKQKIDIFPVRTNTNPVRFV